MWALVAGELEVELSLEAVGKLFVREDELRLGVALLGLKGKNSLGGKLVLEVVLEDVVRGLEQTLRVVAPFGVEGEHLRAELIDGGALFVKGLPVNLLFSVVQQVDVHCVEGYLER